MTVLESEYYETMICEMKDINKNLAEINETLKVLAVQIHENGGRE